MTDIIAAHEDHPVEYVPTEIDWPTQLDPAPSRQFKVAGFAKRYARELFEETGARIGIPRRLVPGQPARRLRHGGHRAPAPRSAP